jgi:transaldolase
MKIFSDGADIQSMKSNESLVDGFTTNPTLMVKAGITNYLDFAKQAVSEFSKPISFEVFSDDFDEMYDQALILDGLSNNVYVKIPITNTKGESSSDLIKELSNKQVKINVTAVFTQSQIESVYKNLNKDIKSILSIFAGRIADTNIDPEPLVTFATQNKINNCEVLWASTREVFNIFQAERCNCDIITVAPNLIEKWKKLESKDLNEFSLDTVKMFYSDAQQAGYSI